MALLNPPKRPIEFVYFDKKGNSGWRDALIGATVNVKYLGGTQGLDFEP